MPISDIFQNVGHAIRAGDSRLRRIDVSILEFLACEDMVPRAFTLCAFTLCAFKLNNVAKSPELLLLFP